MDYVPSLESITDELRVVRDRVRLLVKHWSTDGHFKESLLRHVLRRHLPESLLIGTGFVTNYREASGEIDILILDRNMPTLFKEGELLISTPGAGKAIIEVKTQVKNSVKMGQAINSLAERKAIVTAHAGCDSVWAGLFIYDGNKNRHQSILGALHRANLQFNTVVDLVSYGDNTVAKYFRMPEAEGGMRPSNAWHSFHTPGVAAANFIASLLEHLSPKGRDTGTIPWFTPPANFERKFVIEARREATVTRYADWLKSNPD